MAYADDEVVWGGVKRNSPAHHRSVFYLLVDVFDTWRVMHLMYIGNDNNGNPLFLGARAQMIWSGKTIFRWADSSLVGYDGLIKQGVEVSEIEHFPHPEVAYYDFTVLKIAGIDLSDYEPIQVAPLPAPLTPLEMLSYRADLAEDLLWFFDYPLKWRECRAGVVHADDAELVLHTCKIPRTPAVMGSPIFAEESLIALYLGSYREGFDYSMRIPLSYSHWLDVSPKEKMATTWGEIKAR